jgi:hypothetical protein
MFLTDTKHINARKVWRFQRSEPYITGHTIQRPKEKGEKGQAIIYKILHRLLNIEHNEIH